jgi:beta-galactosidase
MLGKLLLAILLAALPAWAASAARERRNFDAGWRFLKGDVKGAEQPAFNDAAWRNLDLPHDWSIEGPYSASNPACNGFLPGGIGWYRKTFQLPSLARSRRVSVVFDGVYRDSDVWINGHHLGHRPYGYSSFAYELTPYLNFGVQRNVLAVRVDHSEVADSRWYSGSGIYRDVWLVITDPVHVDDWGTYVYTPLVNEAEALVSIETSVVNQSAAPQNVKLTTSIEDRNGQEVAMATSQHLLAPGQTQVFAQQGAVPHPLLWSLEAPNLCTAVSHVFIGGTMSDEYRTAFGIRTIRFDPNHGFFLNGKPEKLKGVCIHHDLGALGAAFYEVALERRLKLLKELGVNAIRCSHNPMAPALYDICDRIGLLVMDEAFDEWIAGKHKWIQGWNVGTPGTAGYHKDFDEWSKRDLQDMVRRDRNHPSVVLWSIGNEIDYPGDPFGHPLGRDGLKPGMLDADVLPMVARQLIADVKELDGTRPVTQALADIQASNATGLARLLDVDGYNYLEQFYARDHATYPERIIMGSENFHSLAAWRAVAENEYVVGQFLWTGVDYLGESGQFPARGSTSGLLDFCGFRKPISYLREALWSQQPMVYAAAREAMPAAGPRTDFGARSRPGRLVEHWNATHDSRKTVPVEVYTNCESAELFLNGRSLGEKSLADRLSPVLNWDVPSEPGVLRVLGKKNGQEKAHFELVTAGPPDHLELETDKLVLKSGGHDLANVEIRVVDSSGRRVNSPDSDISVEVSGAGRLAAMDSGNVRDITPVQAGHRTTYEGHVLAIVRSGGSAAEIRVHATASGLKPAGITLRVE